MYNFILVAQIDGRCWQVQWSKIMISVWFYESISQIEKEKRRPENGLLSSFLRGCLELLFFDSGLLTCQASQIEYSCSANNASFVYNYAFNEWGSEWENSFHTYSSRNLSDSKGFGFTASGTLDNHSLECLRTFLVSFFDFVCY